MRLFYSVPMWVYILYSKEYDRYYIGQTSDLNDRLHRHNSGRERWTSRYVPWELIFKVVKTSRAEAMCLEKKLKNLSKDRIRQFIEKYS